MITRLNCKSDLISKETPRAEREYINDPTINALVRFICFKLLKNFLCRIIIVVLNIITRSCQRTGFFKV